MTWPASHCQHCRKPIPRGNGESEFCSSECAQAHRSKESDERHGIPTSSTALVRKSSTAVQRIRRRVGPITEGEDVGPELNLTLQRFAQPRRMQAVLHPRGFFPFFPIGDLALIAPVELPQALDLPVEPAPGLTDVLERLRRPNSQRFKGLAHAGISRAAFDAPGRPKVLHAFDNRSGIEARLGSSRLSPLAMPNFGDLSIVISRISEQDSFLRSTRPSISVETTKSRETLSLSPADLFSEFLAAPARRVRNAGAQIIHTAPPRPAAFVAPKPAIVGSEIQLKDPSWRFSVLLPMPKLKPEPRDIKPSGRGVVPWFVPSRPKPPVLQLDLLETPAEWKNPRRALLSAPAPAEPQAAGELSALAKALDAAEPSRDLESPWPKRRFIPVVTPLADWWMTCSNQVRVMVIALPLLLAIAIKPLTNTAGAPTMDERPSAPVRSAHAQNPRPGMPTTMPEVPHELEARVERATKGQFDSFKKSIISRAAVEMADDFQAGLDNWDGNSQLGPSWSYDRTGFIRPRALGIYRPSTGLSDYAFEFLGKVDHRAISWVFRASDLNNYYAMKLVDKTGGVTPQMALVHYAVIEGREGPKKEVPLPIPVYKDTLFRIRMDIQGPHFSVQVQGTVVDYWKDSRLKSGGVGFFASRGEESRVRWVQVTHQDDMLGKLCAFLSPYAM